MSTLARMAKRHSEQLIGSILKLEDLAECIMLSDVNGLLVELDDPTGEYVSRWVNFGIVEIPLSISFLNGTVFLRGRYTHRNHTVTVYAAGDTEENSLFSVTLSGPPRFKHPAAALAGPAAMDKKMSTTPHLHELGKLKHKTGLTVYRISKASQLPVNWTRDQACDMQIARANQTVPYIDMRMEKTCWSTFLHWMGLTFHGTKFACYKGDHYIGTAYPKISCGFTRYAYVIEFENAPAPAHVSKTIILASVIVMLLNLGPINVSDEITEEP